MLLLKLYSAIIKQTKSARSSVYVIFISTDSVGIITGVMLARSKMSPQSIKQALLRIEDNKISLDMLKVLRQLAPSQDEAS